MLDLQISVNRHSGRTLLTVSGEVDLASGRTLEQRLDEHAAVDRDLTVDLSEVRFIDAAGLGLLLEARRRVTERGGRFSVARTSPSLERLLALTGARDALGVCEPAV